VATCVKGIIPNIKQFVSLRKVNPSIELTDLRKLKEFFPGKGHHFQLDPSFEPERSGAEKIVPPNKKNNEIFAVLQKFNRLNLLVPIGAPHMWHAAMQSKTVRLTSLGEHYRGLVEQGLI
jgi:hypothetical protein